MGIQRECGVLLPISSLPSKYGIGCFSKSAYEFVDQLKAAGQAAGRFCLLALPAMGIHLISPSLLLQEILISSVLRI